MKAANTVAVDLAAASSVIDDMESAALHGSTSPTRKFLANFQTKLGTKTTRGEDLQFLNYFTTYMIKAGIKT